MKTRTASEARDLYREIVARYEFTQRKKQTVIDRQKTWQSRVDRKLVRLGAEWVTLDEAKATAKQSDDLIADAFEKIKAADFKKAKRASGKGSEKGSFRSSRRLLPGDVEFPEFLELRSGGRKEF